MRSPSEVELELKAANVRLQNATLLRDVALKNHVESLLPCARLSGPRLKWLKQRCEAFVTPQVLEHIKRAWDLEAPWYVRIFGSEERWIQKEQERTLRLLREGLKTWLEKRTHELSFLQNVRELDTRVAQIRDRITILSQGHERACA